MSESRPIPLLGDISLDYGQLIEHSIDTGFVPMRIAGLDGELQQRLSRRGHRITICGYLFGENAAAQLETLQKAAAAGEELTFASDITTALDLQRVVVLSFRGSGVAGEPGKYIYELVIAESPPLPPPAQLEGFGGLDDFGLGDLGFDTDILGELADLAGDIAGAVDAAMDMIDQLAALANLDGLDVSGLLAPLGQPVEQIGKLGDKFAKATGGLVQAFS